MYKTLPNEDELQRKGRLQKEAREINKNITVTNVPIETPYLVATPAFDELSENKIEENDIEENIDDMEEKEKIPEKNKIFKHKQRGRPPKRR